MTMQNKIDKIVKDYESHKSHTILGLEIESLIYKEKKEAVESFSEKFLAEVTRRAKEKEVKLDT